MYSSYGTIEYLLEQLNGYLILFIIIELIIRIIFASRFADIAEEKHQDRSLAFWLCFLFGLPGWLYVIALPNKKVYNDIHSIKQALDSIDNRNKAQ